MSETRYIFRTLQVLSEGYSNFRTGQRLVREGIPGLAVSRRTDWRRVASAKVEKEAMDGGFS